MNIRVKLILDEFDRHRAQFEHLCRDLSEAELATEIPGAPWSVRDYVAHLCTIDGLISPRFAAMVGMEPPPGPATPVPNPFDIDEWNEAAVRNCKGRDIEDLLAEAAIHRAHLAAAIARMTDDDLDRIIPYGGDRKALNLEPTPVRFGGLLWGIAIHDPTHTRDILRALPGRAEQSWIREWLDSVSNAQVPEGVRQHRV
jgi:hypothetical protein